jgi:hypothetical protein
MDDKYIVISIAMVCLTVLETISVLLDKDGAFFLPIVAAIAGLAGYVLPSPISIKASPTKVNPCTQGTPVTPVN